MNEVHYIDKSFAGSRVISASGDTWIVQQGVVGHGIDSTVLHEDENLFDNKIILNGKFETDGMGTAIHAEGTRTRVEIGETGVITAYDGVRLEGTHQTLVNNGLIGDANFAVVTGGANVRVINNGMMEADIGISVSSYHGLVVNNGTMYGLTPISISGQGAKVVLNETSVISGEQNGVQASGDEGTEITIVNRGNVSAGDRGLSLFHADFTVVNRGEIHGDVVSFGGDSIFDFRGGTLDGKIYGDDGDDTYLVSSTAISIIEREDEGFDTLKSSVSYNLSNSVNSGQEIERLQLIGKKDIDVTGNDLFNDMAGNRGDNVLSAGGGIDLLFGGRGNDILIGGSGTDYFSFRTGDGDDVVKDFKSGDHLDLLKWEAIASFKDMLKHHVHMENGDLVISAGADSITLEGVTKDDLVESGFYI
jgi:Ca2+-binding RTX toxin-like protein